MAYHFNVCDDRKIFQTSRNLFILNNLNSKFHYLSESVEANYFFAGFAEPVKLIYLKAVFSYSLIYQKGFRLLQNLSRKMLCKTFGRHLNATNRIVPSIFCCKISTDQVHMH